MALGWFADLAALNVFQAAQPDATAWAALSIAQQTAYALAAYDRIRTSPRFTIPAVPSSSQTELLQMAQGYTALYMMRHLADENLRMGLQAQGVIKADIVGEEYSLSAATGLPIIVTGLLQSMKAGRFVAGSSYMTRDEDA